jgi:hypothetical protein
MTLDEQLEILQAAKRGEKIEAFLIGHGRRVAVGSIENHEFNFHNYRYRVADPYAELKAAAKDPTKEIRIKRLRDGFTGAWWPAGSIWKWDCPPEDYEICNKPTAWPCARLSF